MAGWQLLEGHSYENEANIYFKVNGSLTSMKLEPIQTEDLNQVVTWTDDQGNTRKNTLSELYQMFGALSNQYTDDYLFDTFGDVYFNWLVPSAVPIETIVNE